jgi:parallel beta-helix repeat protein
VSERALGAGRWALVWISLAVPALVTAAGARQVPTVAPAAGMVIDRSVRLAPGTYRLAARDETPAITIRGDDVTVDMTGVTLEGGDPLADPDTYAGTGIAIEDSAGVTIRGGAIRGYKVGILARRAPRLHLTGIDASYNWKQRLWSGLEKESLLDWMSYHDNEAGQWLRYGAAIYLDRADDAEVDHVRVTQGQNGLMVTHSARLTIWNNDFSFNSSVGLGLYRTTDSRVLHNKLDWNVRGYSHGFYYRGQDSTAILMYEQSSNNVVAYNSATHGGDGLFLWAGQSTMDTGQGGANDNYVYRNDFSHAVANGIEATFSRNRFVRNRIEDCWHGVWGGYSHDTWIVGNTFTNNDEAIAIEHGQDITIADNTFTGDDTAIRLWANPSQDPNWGYPKARDTRSRDYLIVRNTFANTATVLDVQRTSSVTGSANAYDRVGTRIQAGDEVTGVDLGTGMVFVDLVEVGELPDGQNAMLPDGVRRGRNTIIVDEWGPYDYRSPTLWPVAGSTFRDRPLRLRVLGPRGTWRVASAEGATLDRRSGQVPGEVVVEPIGRNADVRLALEYIGEPVLTPRGESYAAGVAVPFTFEYFEPSIDWDVRWWTFDEAADPLAAPGAFAAWLRQAPSKRETLRAFDLVGSGALSDGLPRDRVAMRAEGQVELPPGDYELDVISDDGIRVWVDDALVIDRWTIHGSALDQVEISGGAHRLRIEYFEATGWSELKVRFRKR